MKEIVLILFQRDDRPLSDAKEIVVLLGPNLNPNWIPQLPGIRFRQLTYEEVKQVPEYYELTNREVRGSNVRVGLVKGNYCRGMGPIYKFHKERGEWKAEQFGYVETNKAGGTQCVGCKTGSGATYSVRATGPSKVAKQTVSESESKQPTLALNGRVLGVSCHRRDKQGINCKADLSLTFSNRGNEPAIMLQPYQEYEFWHTGTSLALSRSDSEKYSYVYSQSAWPSIYTFPMYRQLAELLDQPGPPANVTRVIKSGDSWTWLTDIEFGVQEENSCDQFVGVEIGWNEIKKLTAPLWLRVAYELWPFNVENFKKDLGGRLRKRWSPYGVLYLEEKSHGRWFGHLTSEPIELDLRQTELRDSPRN